MNITMKTQLVNGCTMGIMTIATSVFHTGELPWKDNEPDVSCVPAGEYQLIPYISPKHGQTWRLHAPVLNVWGLQSAPPPGMRTEVELHSGNVPLSESLGCILIGMASGEMLDPKTNRVEPAVLDSVIAINRLRELLDGAGEEDILIIERADTAVSKAAA